MYVGTAAVVGVTIWCYLSSPDGVGLTMLVSTLVVTCLLIGVGPWLRRARPAYAWLPVSAGAACFLVAVTLPNGIGPTASFELADAVYVAGYVCFFVALLMMTWHVGRAVAARAVLDAGAAGAAVALALWTIACVRSGPPPLTFSPAAVYLVLDVIVLGLAAHLVIRLGRVVTAWFWIFAALCLVLMIDVTRALVAPLSTDMSPLITSGYLMAYAGLALAATHPSIRQLSVAPSRRRAGDGPRVQIAVLGVAVALAIVAMIVPFQGPQDGAVRAGLVSLLLGLLFARHAVAGADLARALSAGAYRATHDELTGLLTRAAVLDDLERRLSGDGQSGAGTAVVLLGCDQLGHVHETWGYAAGDDMLREMAAVLASCAEPDSALGRYGDDAFVLVMTSDGCHDVRRVLERVRERVSQGLAVGGIQRYRVSWSAGVALARPVDGLTPATLVGRAGMAIEDARSRGGERVVWFDAEVEERALARARLAAALQEAVAHDELTLDFQPIFTGPSYRRLAGWEALARWNDAGVGQVSPGVFIPLAESLGLIDDLGRLVMRRACAQLADLRAALGRDDLIVSVNASAPQLDRADFADFVAATLRESGLTGECLWLEITESLVVDRGPQVLRTLSAIREIGVQVCIDDFGTGYASLETLLRLPVDGVKVDRAVIARLSDGSTSRRLGHLLDLLRSMEITHVVAEGIETVEQKEILAGLGWPYVQGWLLGRPVNPAIIRSDAADAADATRSVRRWAAI